MKFIQKQRKETSANYYKKKCSKKNYKTKKTKKKHTKKNKKQKKREEKEVYVVNILLVFK